MLFSSAIFLFLYLPFFLIAYYLLPRRWNNAFLFGASLLFYAWGEGPVVLVLLLSAFINFVAGRLVENGQRRAGLLLSLIGSLSLLFDYKYTNFRFYAVRGFAEAVALPVTDSLTISQIALPIGVVLPARRSPPTTSTPQDRGVVGRPLAYLRSELQAQLAAR